MPDNKVFKLFDKNKKTGLKSQKPFKDNTNWYLSVILILVLTIAFYNQFLGIVGVVIFAVLFLWNYISVNSRNRKWKKYVESLSTNIDSAARYAVFNLPMPLVIIDYEGKIDWYNSKFTELVDEKNVIGRNLINLVSNIDLEKIQDGQDIENMRYNDRVYNVTTNIVGVEEKNTQNVMIMLYWFDKTEHYNIINRYEDEKTVLALLQVDNYNDMLNETKEDKLPFLKAEIEKKVNLWANRMNGTIKKYSNDRYIVIFEKKFLDNLEQKRFVILDDVREIDEGNKIPVTLSIGVGVDGASPSDLEDDAFSALELALGRGGDQAVVKKNNNFEFFGGKTKAVEKRNRVKARVIAHGFRTLIDESSKVIIMGHTFPDMDSFGAAIGVYRGVINRGKDAYIVLNEVSESIKNVYDLFKGDDFYKFINSEEAIDLVEENILVVVVDTHRPDSVECPKLLEMTNRIVLMDHHRRGTNFIDNTVLKYLEPYASSTSELVTEVLQYLENKPNIDKREAEALLAGIAVDTKNFSFKTGVRTFDAAAYLRRLGADTTLVRQLFQDDLGTYTAVADIVRYAETYKDNIAISVCDDTIKNIRLIAAQGADSLLNIKGISTSFVIAKKDDNHVVISARSLGELSVQLILEKIGGGGHLEIAGAQFEGKTVEQVKTILVDAIDEYLVEMKGEY